MTGAVGLRRADPDEDDDDEVDELENNGHRHEDLNDDEPC